MWTRIEDIKIEDVPEVARPALERVLGLVRANEERRTAEIREANEALATTRERFETLIESLGGDDTHGKAVRELYHGAQAAYEIVRERVQHVVEVEWMAFEARNADYRQIPEKVRQDFATLISSPTFEQRFEAPNNVLRMEQALEFALYRNKVNRGALSPDVKPPPAAPVAAPAPAPVQKAPPTVEARRQAIVNDGGSAGGLPKRTLADRDWSEIGNEWDHLLTPRGG